MKALLFCFAISAICLFGCKQKPEFYINGKPYYTQERCVKYVTETQWVYGWGLWNGQFGMVYSPQTVCTCTEYVVDTIALK